MLVLKQPIAATATATATTTTTDQASVSTPAFNLLEADGVFNIPANTITGYAVGLTAGSCVVSGGGGDDVIVAVNRNNPYEPPNTNGGLINHAVTITPGTGCEGVITEVRTA